MNISKTMYDGDVNFAITELNMVEYATICFALTCLSVSNERNEMTLRACNLLKQLTHFEKANPKILNERGVTNGKEENDG